MKPVAHQRGGAQNEQVLARQLSTGQQAMMAIGGAIGTGLFLGSGLAVPVAGPAVIISYLVVAVIAMLLGVALTEMCVAQPTAGSFGVYAGQYLSPFAGYSVRVSYWLMEVVATGGHLVAISIYMQYWLPTVPGFVWTVAFAAALVYLNTRPVGVFGTVAYWLSMIKVAAIAIFCALSTALLLGVKGDSPPGLHNFLAHGGFLPFGLTGIWLGSCFVIYSFIGVEVVGVTSGEAADPSRTVPAAFRRMVLMLSLIYIVTVTLLLAILPWTDVGVGESPFVTVFRRVGIPGAGSLMNFVVLTAALSSANANLYLISRTLFSLARGGFVPKSFGAVNARGTPVNALLISSIGLAVAVLVRALSPDTAYVWFFGVALFGALFVWLMIFITHVAFRRQHRGVDSSRLRYRGPLPVVSSLLGAALVGAILVTTWWVPGLRVTLLAGGPWLAVLAAGYVVTRRRAPRRNSGGPSAERITR